MEAVEQFRLEIGDEGENALFTIEQVEHLLDVRDGNVLAAAADACDILATRFAKEFDFASAARQQFRRSQKAEAYERRAKAIRSRIGGLATIGVTRVDGFSDDVSVREGSGTSRQGRVRRGYVDPDIPV
jgi:hypothetical protein